MLQQPFNGDNFSMHYVSHPITNAYFQAKNADVYQKYEYKLSALIRVNGVLASYTFHPAPFCFKYHRKGIAYYSHNAISSPKTGNPFE